MKLKKENKEYKYYQDGKVLEWVILTKFNPFYVSAKIRAKYFYIETLYHLNTSHCIFNENRGVVSVSYPLDRLVLKIIEEKNKLSRYEKESLKKINMLKQVMDSYNNTDKKQLMMYISSNAEYRPDKALIERLQRDLYQLIHPIKQAKIKQFEANRKHIVTEHVKQVKLSLSSEREVLAL